MKQILISVIVVVLTTSCRTTKESSTHVHTSDNTCEIDSTDRRIVYTVDTTTASEIVTTTTVISFADTSATFDVNTGIVQGKIAAIQQTTQKHQITKRGITIADTSTTQVSKSQSVSDRDYATDIATTRSRVPSWWIIAIFSAIAALIVFLKLKLKL